MSDTVREFDIGPALRIEERIVRNETTAIRDRWQYGRWLLAQRVGKRLPAGLLNRLVEATGKSRSELQYRVKFAERFPSEEALSNVLDNHGTWHEMVNDVLGQADELKRSKLFKPVSLLHEAERPERREALVAAMQQKAVLIAWLERNDSLHPEYADSYSIMARSLLRGFAGPGNSDEIECERQRRPLLKQCIDEYEAARQNVGDEAERVGDFFALRLTLDPDRPWYEKMARLGGFSDEQSFGLLVYEGMKSRGPAVEAIKSVRAVVEVFARAPNLIPPSRA